MSSLRFPIAPYDQDHRTKLRASQYWPQWETLFEEGLRVDDREIVVQAMFVEQWDRDGFRTYKDLADRAADRERHLRDYFDMSGGLLRAKLPPGGMDDTQTERVGVATAILAVNRVAGLTEADWKKIRVSNRDKTLDHEVTATDGSTRFRVEAKGRNVVDPTSKPPTVSNAKRHIEAKKMTARQNASGITSVEYGLITAVAEGSAPQMWVLDPEGEESTEDLGKEQLLARLRYFATHVSLVRSRSHLLIALENRVRAIDAVGDYEALDGVRLVNWRGEPYQLPTGGLGSTVLVHNGRIFGRILFPSRRPRRRDWQGLFIGFDQEIHRLVVRQDFSAIRAYRWSGTRHAEADVAPFDGDDVRRLGRVDYAVNDSGVAFGYFYSQAG